MFTSIANIKGILMTHGVDAGGLHYVNMGATNDTYEFIRNGERYIARCYLPNRAKIADVEYKYIKSFQNNVRSPLVEELFTLNDQTILLYKRLDGHTLSSVYNSLSDVKKDSIIVDVLNNYFKICRYKETYYGDMVSYKVFSHNSWNSFLKDNIESTLLYADSRHNNNIVYVCNWMLNQLQFLKDIKVASLVWSDFSTDNIIVHNDGCLSGFVDFEGLLSGDPLLGISYFFAQGEQNDISKRIYEILKSEYHDVELNLDRIDFYAIFRYLRLLKYSDMPLPNGRKRDSINSFLPYSKKLIDKLTTKP